MKKLLILSTIFLPVISFAQNNYEPYQPKFIGAGGENFLTIEEKKQKLLQGKISQDKPTNLQNAITPQEKYNNQLPENLAKKAEEGKVLKMNDKAFELPENTQQNLKKDIKNAQDNAIKKAFGN